MNELPERHVPVPRVVEPRAVEPLESGPLMVAVDRVLDRAVPLLIAGLILALVVGGLFAALSLLADQPAACVTEMTDAGQAVCVPR